MGFKLLAEVAPARPANGDRPSVGPTYRKADFGDRDPALDDTTTLYSMFESSVAQYGAANCLGHRPVVNGAPQDYVWWTYKETGAKVAALGSALQELGVPAGAKLSVFGANCPEWMLAIQACNRMSYTCVPLYDSLGENAVEYILGHSGACAVFVSKAKFSQLAGVLPKLGGQVKVVVHWGESDQASITAAEAAGASVLSVDGMLELGANRPHGAVPPKVDDLCTIMYTSGTTGQPKGVMLTHKALVARVLGSAVFMEPFVENLGPGNVFFSYLPLAHILDRSAEDFFLYAGGAIGYWRGDLAGLADDMAALKPTILAGVPRVFDKIYSGVTSKVSKSGFLKKWLFNYAFSRKLRALDRGVKAEKASPLMDRLVFNKIKNSVGGRVSLIITGGAPIARHTEDFLRVTMCCPIVQGYGLTETVAGAFFTIPDCEGMAGTVGLPQPVCAFRLESVPEMQYDACGDHPKGEICIQGPATFSGYFKDEAQTDEVLEKDGWFHTGDIGEISGDGTLKVIDRKKNIFKLSQGEYISVEMVEAVYKKNAMVEQVWVYGDSFKSYLVAVVVPVKDALMVWASQNGISGSFEEVCEEAKALEHVLDVMNVTAKEAKLRGFEKIRALHLEPEQFSVVNDTLTPSFKLRRPQLLKKYGKVIGNLYSGMS
eukprot:evm.model.scf_27.6 EVM.evm.TU.scf_27.6   scf_27:41716-47095(+)